jgi:hypothetical protein
MDPIFDEARRLLVEDWGFVDRRLAVVENLDASRAENPSAEFARGGFCARLGRDRVVHVLVWCPRNNITMKPAKQASALTGPL